MAKYFEFSAGLRGCYMPDQAFVFRAQTRRDLKDLIESEARYLRDADFLGASKKNVAAFVAECWRRHGKPGYSLPIALPYRRASQPGNYCFGLFLSPATRAEWIESQKEND